MKFFTTILVTMFGAVVLQQGVASPESPRDSVVNYPVHDSVSGNPLLKQGHKGPAIPSPHRNKDCQVIDQLATLYFDSIYHHPDTSSLLYKNWEQTEASFLDDSLFAHRVQTLPTNLPLTYNRHVKRWIQVYTIERRELTEKVLGLKDHYYPLFEAKLREYDMPIALKHLSIVESALNPAARSWMGATGLWQFMYGTALMHDLEINYYVDERSDPFAATDAALQYLKSLHHEFGDWLLVIAAYNCGPGKVRRAIRYGNSRDYWEIRRYLPRETRGYVPAFIAVNYVMNHYEAHQLQPKEFEGELPVISPSAVGQVTVHKRVNLKTLSRLLEVSEETLSFLNPDLKKDLVPNLSVPYTIQLPCQKVPDFHFNEDTIYQVADATMTKGSEEDKIVYRVRWGDNLGSIANRFHCSVREIMRWNGLHSTRIHPNQRLHIYMHGQSPEPKESQAKTASSQDSESSSSDQEDTEESSSVSYNPFGKFLYHEVKRGDTLWDIAQEYPGATVQELKKVNDLSSGYELKPGMILKVNLSS